MTAPPPVRVTIDRLVLHGVDRADAAAVQRALAAAVGSALAAPGSRLPGAGDLADLSLSVPGSSDPAELGRSSGARLGSAILSGGTDPGSRAGQPRRGGR